MKAVFKNLNEQELTSVPSVTFVSRVLTESHHILMTQLGEVFDKEDDLTLTCDAATRDNVHFFGSQVRTKEGERYLLGIEKKRKIEGNMHKGETRQRK